MSMSFVRTADPYRDLDVIDARAPRFNQATIGSLSLVAVATGWWAILVLLAAQLVIGLRFGRRYCLACVAYFELIQPRFGEGPLEDARPPRLANQIGFAVLSAASITYATGFVLLGAALGLLKEPSRLRLTDPRQPQGPTRIEERVGGAVENSDELVVGHAIGFPA